MSVTFTPTTLGSASGILTLTDSALTSPQTVSLTGTGSLPVTFSPGSLSFSSTALGNTSAARTVTATNRQTVTLNIASITTSAGFSVASSTCGASLASGASCTVGVTFSPTTLGSITGAFTFSDDAPNSPQTVGLSGTGVAPVTLSSSSLSFWTVSVGTTSAAKTVTVSNRQNVALSLGSIAAGVPFAVASTTCGASLAAGANCSVTATFSPTATGSVTETLTFVDSAVTSPQVVSLSGTGQ